MYVREDYSKYKYLVEVSDNYVVLTNQSSAGGIEGGEEIDIIYQFLEPSELVIEDTKTVYGERYYTKVEISQDLFSRADHSDILLSATFFILLAIFVINQVTEFICKGGLFSSRG